LRVGSLNPVKIHAVKDAFSLFFDDILVEGVKVDSKVSSQPVGDEVILGAVNRAKNAYSEEIDFSIGIEAGLVPFPHTTTGYLDLQFCAIFDGSRTSIGCGPGFEYPAMVVQKVKKGREVGEIMAEISGIENLGKTTGAVGFLTRNKLSRRDITKIAVIMALIPVLNNKVYYPF